MAVNEKISLSDIRKYLKDALGLKKFKFNTYNKNTYRYEADTEIAPGRPKTTSQFDQGDVISAMIKGKDVIAMMPTGGGKSLCFEIPAICAP